MSNSILRTSLAAFKRAVKQTGRRYRIDKSTRRGNFCMLRVSKEKRSSGVA